MSGFLICSGLRPGGSVTKRFFPPRLCALVFVSFVGLVKRGAGMFK